MGRFPRAKKHFGQNFLHNPNVLKKLIGAISRSGGTDFLEIGPGTGAMTTLIHSFAEKMLLVEIDQDMLTILDEIPELNGVTKLNQSFLDLSEETILETLDNGYHVIGNLPYYITTPCIEHVLLRLKNWNYAYFMVQKEVAQRILADSGSKVYGRLTVFCKLFAEIELISHVPRACFQPVPGVDSSFISFKRNLMAEGELLQQVLDLTRIGFGQRRKQLSGLLARFDANLNWRQGLESLGIVVTARAEDLTVPQWLALAKWSSAPAC